MKKLIFIYLLIIMFIFPPIMGQTWSALKRLSWTSGQSQGPSITADQSNGIHVAWHDATPGNHEIFYKRSTDSGTTWSAYQRLTWTSTTSFNTSIAADSSTGIHMVWQDDVSGYYEIYYKRSTNSGVYWSALKRLTWRPMYSGGPSIAVGSGAGIHIIWYDSLAGAGEIFYKKSTDSGVSWSGRQRLTWNSGTSDAPSITLDSINRIHVAWRDNTPGNSEIFYKNSTDNGATWSALKRLTWNGGSSNGPSISSDSSSRIHVAWHDDTPGNKEIYYRNSTDNGATWSALKRLTWNATYSGSLDLTSDSGNGIHVVWGESDAGNNFYEIYYRNSTDSGATWLALKRLTWNAGRSQLPSIAADISNGIHVVWDDDTLGNKEIFYKNRK